MVSEGGDLDEMVLERNSSGIDDPSTLPLPLDGCNFDMEKTRPQNSRNLSLKNLVDPTADGLSHFQNWGNTIQYNTIDFFLEMNLLQ